MRTLFDKQPEYIQTILVQTTAATEWSVFLESAILDLNDQMSGLQTDCDAYEFQRKYAMLKAQKQQVLDLLDLMQHFNTQRQT